MFAAAQARAALADLDRDHPGLRHLGRDGERDRRGARAEVDDECGAVGGQGLPRGVDGRARDVLGLGPGHEDPGPDGEVEVAERRAPGQVL